MTSFDAVLAKARAIPVEGEVARRGVKLIRQGQELVGACPKCGGTDRFAIHIKKQVFNCRGCGAKGGDAIALVQFLDGVDFKTAVATLTGSPPDRRSTVAKAARADDDADERHRKFNAVRHIWNRRRPITGTVAEHYLRFRGLNTDANHLDYMGFDPEAGWREVPDDSASPMLHVPCLITGFRPIEGAGDEIVAIQKTRLSSDGSKWVETEVQRAPSSRLTLTKT